MNILAIDTSAAPVSVALLRDGFLAGEFFLNIKTTHSQTLMPMLESLLSMTDCRLQDIDVFAVNAGPGSFTGIRIGVASVKGMTLPEGKPCAAVSTLAAMAYGLPYEHGVICAVMDARRSQVYNALFEIKNGKPVRLCDDRPVSLDDLANEIKALPSPVFILGDGAAVTSSYLTKAGIPFETAPDNLIWQSAWGVAMAALSKTPGDADSLKPVYLRLSQAERERLEKEGRA